MAVLMFKIKYLSEYAISVQFAEIISESTFQRITSFAALLRQQPFIGFTDAVSAYVTLSVYYDPLQVANATALTGTTGFEKVAAYLTTLYQELQIQPSLKEDPIVIPVCYGGNDGPDLDEVADANKLTTKEVIAIHTAGIYKVYLIGFVPGFAYLGGMDERLATPRKAVPRRTVPVGSVGIAGAQTGIYSLNSPGGWQIIGRTPYSMFNANRQEPSLLKAGDQVIFESITTTEFERLSQKQGADSNQ